MVTFYVKRVPLNFSCPPNTSWSGYNPSLEDLRLFPELVDRIPELSEFGPEDHYCFQCLSKYKRCMKQASHCVYHNPENAAVWRHDPPEGDGFQVWTKYVQGPISPVFSSFEAVCLWMEENASRHTRRQASKDEWANLLVLEGRTGVC